MKRYLQVPITGLLISTLVVAVFFLIFNNHYAADIALIVVNALVLSVSFKKQSNENRLLTVFLALFLLGLVTAIFEAGFLSSVFFISAYTTLCVSLLNGIDIAILWKTHNVFIIVLTFFVLFIMYFITSILYENEEDSLTFIVENISNLLVVSLLCLSFINFLYNDSKKALVLFVMSSFFVFSEILKLFYLFDFKYTSYVLVAYKLLAFSGFISCFYYLKIKKDKFFDLLG